MQSILFSPLKTKNKIKVRSISENGGLHLYLCVVVAKFFSCPISIFWRFVKSAPETELPDKLASSSEMDSSRSISCAEGCGTSAGGGTASCRIPGSDLTDPISADMAYILAQYQLMFGLASWDLQLTDKQQQRGGEVTCSVCRLKTHGDSRTLSKCASAHTLMTTAAVKWRHHTAVERLRNPYFMCFQDTRCLKRGFVQKWTFADTKSDNHPLWFCMQNNSSLAIIQMASATPTENFSENVADFWVQPNVKYIDNPSELQFLRDHVNSYTPVILRNVISHWPALSKWSLDYLSAECTGSYSINVTPDGRADSCKEINAEKYFAYPAEVEMSMPDFCQMLKNRLPGDAVPYLSQQDDNLTKHFPNLLGDISAGLPLAHAAFGCCAPEATNLWIGDERSTSSLHKDFFENMYAVISGTKTFVLYPPTDVLYLHETTLPTMRYEYCGGTSPARVELADLRATSEGCAFASLPWIDIDPDDPQLLASHPNMRSAHPMRVTVRAGEVLYIPAMWYHQVSQTEITIAVNFWYEQRFDFR